MAGTALRKDRMFRTPERSLEEVDIGTAARVVTAAADIAVVVDTDSGVVRDVALGDDTAAPTIPCGDWIGRPFEETVAVDSRVKIVDMLQEAAGEAGVRFREINHRFEDGLQVPVRYSAVRLGDKGPILALGRDLRSIARLQQQLVEAQQSMEREYARLRHAETRYRLLFQITSEAVLVADAATFEVTEANPAARALWPADGGRIVGGTLSRMFEAAAWPVVEELLGVARVEGRGDDVRARLAADGAESLVSASLFRQDRSALLLVRISTKTGVQGGKSPQDSQVLDVMESLPEGFVVVDQDRRIRSVNASFLDLAQLATKAQARGEPLERWLGRPGVDLDILMANLKEHGAVRGFATILRGELGSVEQADLTAVAAPSDRGPCFGFVIRAIPARREPERPSAQDLPRSVEQLTGLVGRVSLKEIVKETTDVIERLCIEAALEVSGDNRASAAQILGLSRQSLYAKLRRHGLGDLDPDVSN